MQLYNLPGVRILKVAILTILIVNTLSCSKYRVLDQKNILSVYPVFSDTSFLHYDGYKLSNGTIVRYDKKNIFVKRYLAENKNHLDGDGDKEDTHRILKLVQHKKVFKPVPLAIKTLPFREFGYIKTEGKIIFYGLSPNTLFDLTGNRVYH